MGASGAGAPAAGPRVLLVGDDRATILGLGRALQRAGYRVSTTRDPARAMALARRAAPAVILADLLIPAAGGLALLRRLARPGPTSGIPVIGVAGAADPGLETEALAAGARRVLRRPVDPERLVEAIRETLGGASGGSIARRPALHWRTPVPGERLLPHEPAADAVGVLVALMEWAPHHGLDFETLLHEARQAVAERAGRQAPAAG